MPRLILFLLPLMLAVAAPSAQARPAAKTNAAPPPHQTLTYAVYAGGLNVVAAEIVIDYPAADRYSVALTAKTRGFLGSLVPWQGSFATEGWRTKKGETPELYRSSSTWQKKEEIKEFTYGRDGTFVGFKKSEAGKDKSPKTVDHKLADGTTDSLTATLLVMNGVGAGGRCEGSRDVFDGLRRFKLAFHDDGVEDLPKTNYNVFSGPTAKCTVEVTPDGGKWHVKPRGWLSIQEQGRQKGSLPTVWLARLTEHGPALPVKIRVVTDYGTLFMQLASYKAKNRIDAPGAPEDSGQ
jgi:hypothetical protein